MGFQCILLLVASVVSLPITNLQAQVTSSPQFSHFPNPIPPKRKLAQPNQTPKAGATVVDVGSFKLLGQTTGWASTGKAIIWTTDNGMHWKDITPANPHYNRLDSNSQFVDVFFHDDRTGCALLTYQPKSTDYDWAFDLSCTSDGGESWRTTPVTASGLAADRLGGTGNVSFSDDLHGWVNLGIQSGSAFSVGALLSTSDGGRTWNFVKGDPGLSGEILLQDNQNGWLIHDDGEELYSTLDGGKSFHEVSLQAPNNSSFGFESSRAIYNLPIFEDNLQGYEAVLYSNAEGSKSAVVLFITKDGGRTWTVDRKLTGLGLGSFGTLATTTVADSTWIIPIASEGVQPTVVTVPESAVATYPHAVPNMIRKSSFITPLQGWISSKSGLFSTVDGGNTWYKISPTYIPTL